MNRQQRRAAAKQSQAPGRHEGAPAGHDPAVAAILATGIKFHQSGNLRDAQVCYEQALALQPGNADANHLLGVLAAQTGHPDLALDLIRQAIRLHDRSASRTHDRSLAYLSSLGTTLRQMGRGAEAVDAFRRAVRLAPQDAQVHYNLANVLCDNGKPEEAVAAFREAIRIRPDFVAAHYNLGIVLSAQGKLTETVAVWRDVVRMSPDFAEAWNNIGAVLLTLGSFDEAATACREALRIRPGDGRAHCNIGSALAGLGRLDEAAAAFQEALRVDPQDATSHYNLGLVHADQGRLDQSVAAYREALRIRPDHTGVHCNIGLALLGQGRLDDAVAAFGQAAALQPDEDFPASNLLLCMNYDAGAANARIFEAHRAWDARHGRAVAPAAAGHANDRTPERRLKIGYVSPDFRRHPVASVVEPLLRCHDGRQVEVHCYAETPKPDATTARLQALAGNWLNTAGMPDAALAERIRADGIDILVDLAGHTAGNRLRVFARKPAPVQVSWLGYPNTRGLGAIDYRLVDAVTDPEGEADAFASETLVRLAGGFLCWGAPDDVGEPAPPPCLAGGAVTFGSFNSPAKLSDATLDAFAALLTRLPEARLLLKGHGFADPAVCAWFEGRLSQRGIAAGRVELAARLPDETAHLRFYDRVDIALDPFPYNGMATTCEALWMGVPVVTLAGDRHAGRIGASLMTRIGLAGLIAGSVDGYVEIAAGLAGDPNRLRDLRRSLRPRLAASPLCNAPAFARTIEDAYRTMWRRWCAA